MPDDAVVPTARGLTDAPPEVQPRIGSPVGDPLEGVLEMVAQGRLSPRDAGEVIRAMGGR